MTIRLEIFYGSTRSWFSTYETEIVHFLAVLENSALPVGGESSHATFKVPSEFLRSEVTSLIRHVEKHRMTFGEKNDKQLFLIL